MSKFPLGRQSTRYRFSVKIFKVNMYHLLYFIDPLAVMTPVAGSSLICGMPIKPQLYFKERWPIVLRLR
jgi:hypothetical protein